MILCRQFLSKVGKIFEGEILNQIDISNNSPSNILLNYNFQVNIKSIDDPDNNFKSNSEALMG